jgi:hypothetical protein
MDNHISPRTEKKGFTVKKSGMNNPLHSNVTKQSSQLPPQLPPAIIPNRSNHNNSTATGPVVRKPMAPPSTNDFFAEMGLEAKPKFGPSTSAAPHKKRLGAVALPVDTSKDTWDDDDLDDLLD